VPLVGTGDAGDSDWTGSVSGAEAH